MENEQMMFEEDLLVTHRGPYVPGEEGLDMPSMEMDVTEETIQEQSQELIHEDGLDGQMGFHPITIVQPEVELTPEEQLRSSERLDRSSPDLWPQNLPTAAQQIITKNAQKNGLTDHLGIWAQGLDPEDINLLHQFGSLTSSSLVEEVKKLQNIAYQLSLDEAKEMTRGKLLHALMEEPTNEGSRHVKRLWN